MILKQGFNRVAALPIPQLRGDGIWDSAVPALGLCACRCPHKRGIIRLETMTTLPEHQSVDDCHRSLLLPRLKQLVTLRREDYIRIYLLLDGLSAPVWNQSFPSPRWICLKRLSELHRHRFGIKVFLLLRHCLSAAPSLSGATLLSILEGVI